MVDNELRSQIGDRIAAWRVVVDRLIETESSILAFGLRDGQPVAVKVARHDGDDWRCAAVLSAFEGHGMVCLLDHVDGAVLLERLKPGTSLASLAIDGDDERATVILADVMRRLSPRAAPPGVPTVQEWGEAFERHERADSGCIPGPVFDAARQVHSQLCASQSRPRLLHGDLHHDNVLLDADRGWLAIDPKGVVGEPEYEMGAAIRNPYERPDLFTEPATIERRVDRFARELRLDAGRILGWAFAQAVLAAVWAIEDGFPVGPDHAWLALARNIRPMLRGTIGL